MAYANTVANLPGTWSYLYKPPRRLDSNGNLWVATIAFRTDYANLVPFVLAIAGTSQTITTTYGNQTRVLRLQHPEYTGLYASAIRTETAGGPTVETIPTPFESMYSDVRVDVEFSSVLYGVDGDQAFMTWEVDQGSVYTTAPGRKFKFPSGEPIDQDAGAFAVQNSYVLTLFNCPLLNDDVIDTVSASPVNSATFMNRPAGSLLFGGCRSVYQQSMGGVITYQKSLTFTYRSYDWNQAFQRSGVLGTPVDPAGNTIYPTCDFNQLLN